MRRVGTGQQQMGCVDEPRPRTSPVPATADDASGGRKKFLASQCRQSTRTSLTHTLILAVLGQLGKSELSPPVASDADGLGRTRKMLLTTRRCTDADMPSSVEVAWASRDAAPSARNHRACEPPNCKVGFLLVPDRREAHDRSQYSMRESQCGREVGEPPSPKSLRSRATGRAPPRRADLWGLVMDQNPKADGEAGALRASPLMGSPRRGVWGRPD